ncbi:MAG: aldolase/citrate lyase family protein [Actinomycetota bacterium]|nr:aldolase/citrate lyase family protein [Actinomycetota bacterium]
MTDPESDPPATRLPAKTLAAVEQALVPVDQRRVRLYPGDAGSRQPVHTVYVPADRVVAGLPSAWGVLALQALEDHAPDAYTMADVLGMDPLLVAEVWELVLDKLRREPIEDLRVDAEDGYRGTAEAEDGDVIAAASAVGGDIVAGTASPFLGLRAKCLEAPVRARGLRSLDLFLGALIDGVGGPQGLRQTDLRITLPKITDVTQVEVMMTVLDELEAAHGLAAGQLGLELQVETPQAVLGSDGRASLAPMVHAAGARCRGLHFGTYDYSASLGIAAAHQASDHPAADHAKATMQLAVAGTRAAAVDGSTNILPVGSSQQVNAGWRLHAGLVRRALERGFYQGWDLHPAQLVTRYIATYAFFRQAMPAAASRLRAYVWQRDGTVLDEPATAKALALVLIRGLDCGALSIDEITAATDLDRAAMAALAGRRPPPHLP